MESRFQRGELSVKISVVVVTAYSDIAEAHSFIGLTKAGCRVTVLCAMDGSSVQFKNHTIMVENGVDVHPLKLKRRFDRPGISKIRHHLIESNARILHVFNNKAVTNGLLAAKGLPVHVVAYRGVAGRESFFSPYSWITYLNPRISRVICVSDAVRNGYLTMSMLGFRLPREKYVTIHKGHNVDWYAAEPSGLSGFGIPDNAFVVGTIAMMRPHNPKGIPELLNAVNYLPDESIHFLIVGHMEEKLIKKYVKGTRWKDRVHFTGIRKDAPALIAGVDLYVLPSVKVEGLPKTVIEAMAQGIPPVVTNSGGSAELVVDGQSGIVVEPGNSSAIADAVSLLKDNPDKRLAMGRSARQRIIDRFNCKSTVRKILAVYRELLEH